MLNFCFLFVVKRSIEICEQVKFFSSILDLRAVGLESFFSVDVGCETSMLRVL